MTQSSSVTQLVKEITLKNLGICHHARHGHENVLTQQQHPQMKDKFPNPHPHITNRYSFYEQHIMKTNIVA